MFSVTVVYNSHEDSGDCGQRYSDTDVPWTRCLGLSTYLCQLQVLIWLAIGFGLASYVVIAS